MGEKLLITNEGKTFHVKDTLADFHTQFGYVKKSDLRKKGVVKTNKGVELAIIEPRFIDLYKKLRRHAQIINFKDIGLIVTNTGINKSSFVVDIGSGSGALACYLAAISKKVVTYDIDDRSISTTKENISMLGLKNITVKKQDAYEKIDEKNADVVTIDLREPWKALDNAQKALRVGGFIAVYSPNITQMLQAVNEARTKGLIVIKAVELIEREWVLDEMRARPDFAGLGHTGFLGFMRKIR